MNISRLYAISTALALGSCSASVLADNEREIALTALPAPVAQAARQAVEGITLTEAEEITTLSGLMYEVEGELGRDEYEILITPEGEVVMVVQED